MSLRKWGVTNRYPPAHHHLHQYVVKTIFRILILHTNYIKVPKMGILAYRKEKEYSRQAIPSDRTAPRNRVLILSDAPNQCFIFSAS